jgi:hypothetical protein
MVPLRPSLTLLPAVATIVVVVVVAVVAGDLLSLAEYAAGGARPSPGRPALLALVRVLAALAPDPTLTLSSKAAQAALWLADMAAQASAARSWLAGSAEWIHEPG